MSNSGFEGAPQGEDKLHTPFPERDPVGVWVERALDIERAYNGGHITKEEFDDLMDDAHSLFREAGYGQDRDTTIYP